MWLAIVLGVLLCACKGNVDHGEERSKINKTKLTSGKTLFEGIRDNVNTINIRFPDGTKDSCTDKTVIHKVIDNLKSVHFKSLKLGLLEYKECGKIKEE